jgi:uncharacterized protein YyaL (SSP411 family)
MKRKLTYSNMDVLMADPDNPTPEFKRNHQLTRMWQGLHALETSAEPTLDDWTVVSDAINMMETLLGMGWVQDPDDTLTEAMGAMAEAGRRHQEGHALRLSGKGIQTIRGILEDYASALEQLSYRVMIVAHRRTEKRLHEILDGKVQPHDVRFI